MEKHFALDCNCCGLMESSIAIFVIEQIETGLGFSDTTAIAGCKLQGISLSIP